MSKNKKIIWAVTMVVIIITAIFAAFFISELFKVYVTPPQKQPFFVNCTYYIYPNKTFVVNVTLVVALGKYKPFLRDPKDGFECFQLKPNGKLIDKDKDGMLSVGDQFYGNVTNHTFPLLLFYSGRDADGRYIVSGPLWDSDYGPCIWKE